MYVCCVSLAGPPPGLDMLLEQAPMQLAHPTSAAEAGPSDEGPNWHTGVELLYRKRQQGDSSDCLGSETKRRAPLEREQELEQQRQFQLFADGTEQLLSGNRHLGSVRRHLSLTEQGTSRRPVLPASRDGVPQSQWDPLPPTSEELSRAAAEGARGSPELPEVGVGSGEQSIGSLGAQAGNSGSILRWVDSGARPAYDIPEVIATVAA